MDFLKANLKELLDKTAKNQLVLPNFQRDYVWRPEQQRMLIASLLVNLPIGTFLILDGQANDFISKELCFNRKAKPTDTCSFLLDGQQRLSTIRNVFSDLFGFTGWENNCDFMHYHLKYRWFLDLNEEACKESLGYERLRFLVELNQDGRQESVPILRTKEPNDILDCIKYYPVYKTTRLDSFYHPGQKFNGVSDYDKRLELSAKYAQKLMLPLYDFLSDDKTVIKNCLKNLANLKAESLKNRAMNDEGNGYALGYEYLGHLDSDIQVKYKNQSFAEISSVWDQLKERWVEDILEYFKDLFKSELMIPNIKSNELSRATSVFEYMNKGGTPLDTFDIMVAKYADVGEEETLYEKLNKILTEEFKIPNEVSDISETISYTTKHFGIFTNETISKAIKEQFLNFLCLINKQKDNDGIQGIDVTYIKKEKILNLTKTEIESSLDDAGKALKRALAFLQFRCGIHNYNLFSYSLMLIPIGLILKNDNFWTNRFVLNKLEFWYWTSLFSGRFREKQNQRAISETRLLSSWISGGNVSEIPSRLDSVFVESNYSDITTLLLENEDKSVPVAIHNGILQYILSNQPNDFTQDVYKLQAWKIARDGEAIQDHHIIPLGSAKTLGESSKALRNNKGNLLNSPLNRTFITQRANNQISSLSIDKYLPLLNQAVQYSHCLGISSIAKIDSDAGFQKQFMQQRYADILKTLKNELERLKS